MDLSDPFFRSELPASGEQNQNQNLLTHFTSCLYRKLKNVFLFADLKKKKKKQEKEERPAEEEEELQRQKVRKVPPGVRTEPDLLVLIR